MTVAVLFARADSTYKTIDGCDVWDAERNALNWPGGSPVIAHPPCRAWASLRHCAKPREGEKDLAFYAIAMARQWGGVLEHPQLSTLWRVAGLPEPRERDKYGGFTLIIDQHWWGHRARKRTRLYIVGMEPHELPNMPMKLGEATHTVGLWSGRDKARCRPSIAKHEFESTPTEMALWLVDLARRCKGAAK
ncbi:hypothetical protein [Sulfuriferula sp.]|uniref:hypothetical protein n=1 Tax=Sulfuriferula sp. TaxID=2025307 RepID=UPI00272F47B5|nr:hypothetical protein [Sulfuriferula sp.]MDP2026431.1 hypothetical protein [Sulfuriferula sp.]